MSASLRKRRNAALPRIDAMCHKPTYAVQQTTPLFDQLVGAGGQVPQRPRSLEVDDNAREVSNPSARRSCLAERISETIGHPDYADQDYTHTTME
jgi:hypothetical protein